MPGKVVLLPFQYLSFQSNPTNQTFTETFKEPGHLGASLKPVNHFKTSKLVLCGCVANFFVTVYSETKPSAERATFQTILR